MTYDELRNEFDSLRKTDENTQKLWWALRDLLHLHKASEPIGDDQFITCETCNYEYFREYPWPCETGRILQKVVQK